MIPDLVTTIIPVHNRAAMLREAVASVIAQTYRPIEIIIIDDGSTDETGDVARELARAHPEIHIVRQANGGAGAAREAGRRLSRGEFRQHLDSDDVLLPRKFELQVAALRTNPECAVAYGRTQWRRRDGTLVPTAWGRTGERIETMFPAMLQSRWWTTHTPLYRATVLDAAGPWLPLRRGKAGGDRRPRGSIVTRWRRSPWSGRSTTARRECPRRWRASPRRRRATSS